MSLKGNDLFQVPDWINSDGRKSVKVTRSRPNVNVNNGTKVTRPTPANVRLVSNVKLSRPSAIAKKSSKTKSKPRPPSVRDESSGKSSHIVKSASHEQDYGVSRGESSSELVTDIRTEQTVKSNTKYRVENSSYLASERLTGEKQGVHNHPTTSSGQSRNPSSRKKSGWYVSCQ